MSNEKLVKITKVPIYKKWLFERFGLYEDECAKSEAAMMIMYNRI